MNFARYPSVALLGKTLAAAVALAFGVAAHADPITYTFSGAANGSYSPFGGTLINFADRNLTVTITTDTTNIDNTRFGAGIPATNTLVTGSINISGVGNGSFSQPLYVFDNHSTQTVGFGNLGANDLINVRALGVGLDTYDLKTNFGPIVGTPPNFVAQFQNIPTSFGNLTLSRLDGATFRATVAAVPEPQTWALLGAGMLFVAAQARKRRAG